MDDLALALDLAAHPHHRRAEYGAAVRLENLGPDDEIRDMGLVLERDEHDALGRSRLLAHEHDAGEIDPAPVLHALQFLAADHLARAQLVAKEAERVGAPRQARGTLILDPPGAFAHRPQQRPLFPPLPLEPPGPCPGA